MISTLEWAEFAQALYDFNEEVGKQFITWKRVSIDLPRYGEDTPPTSVDITLEALVSYNAFKIWPLGAETTSGIVDDQYCHILLNNQYLSEEGYLTASKNFNFNPIQDTFIINGLEYISKGDTPVAQDQANPLYTIVILERKSRSTGSVPRP